MFNINQSTYKKTTVTPFLMTGFRPFFLLASIFAMLVMGLWGSIYWFDFEMPLYGVSGMTWHAHEMIYGYSLAVVAGFLLTAIRNWTRIQTADGKLLLVLVVFWVIGRIPPVNFGFYLLQSIGDVLFLILLLAVVSKGIMRMKLWRHIPILFIIGFLIITNIGYYLSVHGLFDASPQPFIYLALYLVLTLLFVFSRRLIPNFIQSSIQLKVAITNRYFVDASIIPLFLIFSFNEIFYQHELMAFLLSTVLLILHVIRLYDWYRKDIWKHQLVWSLYLGYFFLSIAFLFKMGVFLFGISPFLGLHVFTIGGLGLITTSMMARVSYGHTARNIFNANKSIKWVFVFIICSVLIRSLAPILYPLGYKSFVGIGMLFWVMGFMFFVFLFFKILTTKKPDGLYG